MGKIALTKRGDMDLRMLVSLFRVIRRFPSLGTLNPRPIRKIKRLRRKRIAERVFPLFFAGVLTRFAHSFQ
jgi:hypothetical protein